MIPYVGDLAKLGRLPRLLQTVERAVELARTDRRFAEAIRPAIEQLRRALDAVPTDSLPAAAREQLQALRGKVDEFLRSAPSAVRGDANALRHVGEGTETAINNTDTVQRRLFHQPTAQGDPNMPAGYGETDRYGNIRYSTAGTPTDRALVRNHERVHQFLSPKFSLLREFRADLRMTLYQRSHFMRYLEEAMAETYAQLRVNGLRGLPDGVRFPITYGYVELRHVVTEAAIGAVTVGGVTYGAYVLSSAAAESRNSNK